MHERFAPSASGRRTVATYRRYADAQRAVDFLADERFPVERMAIVAQELRLVEQVTGRLDFPRAAMQGAVSGGTTGVFLGLVLGLLLFTGSLLTAVLYGLVVGALIGAFVNVLAYTMTGGRRDFSSATGLDAGRFDLMVDEEVATDAERLLARLPAV